MINRTKGFLRIIENTTHHYFTPFKISCVNLNMASSVANLFLKPNCCPTNILLLFICSITLIYKAFSKTFEKEINSNIGL